MTAITATISDTVALTATIDTPPAGLPEAISDWQAGATLVRVGGHNSSAWVSTTTANGGASGRTFIIPGLGLRQDATITQIKVTCNTIGGGAWKLKLFRYNTSTLVYDFVAEESFTPAGTGVQTVSLSGVAGVAGDVPALFVPALEKGDTGGVSLANFLLTYADGDISTSNAFATDFGAPQLHLELFANRPYLAVTGDSIMAGNNTGARYYTYWENDSAAPGEVCPGPAANVSSTVAQSIDDIIALQYQNLAAGGEDFAFVAGSAIGEIAAIQPATIVIHCGVNDVNGGRTWAQVESNLDTIQAGLPTGATLFVNEILPWTNGNDSQAATIRTWNANLSTWCAANGAVLIACHDSMGQIRVSTGELDDLLAAYDQDGVHLTAAGVDALAAIIYAALFANPVS